MSALALYVRAWQSNRFFIVGQCSTSDWRFKWLWFWQFWGHFVRFHLRDPDCQNRRCIHITILNERENEGWKTYAQVRWRKREKEKARVCMCTSVLATKRKIPTHWTSNRARKTSSNLLYWNKTISAVMTQNLSTIIHCSRQYIYCCANTRKTPTRIYTIFFLINIVIIWTQFCANSKKKIESKHLGKLTKWNCFTSM